MKLKCYPITDVAVEIAPGRQEREWMDAFPHNHPYRCLPLNIANTSGWELLTPTPIRATWNGKSGVDAITIESPFHVHMNAHWSFATSHFGGGVLTLHAHHLFRTEPGWDLFVSGAPNWIKHGIQPLTGIVESDWLPHPFTMNWRFTEPGTVTFAKNEPFCWIMPVPHAAIDSMEPVIMDITKEPELSELQRAWQKSRENFLAEEAKRATADKSEWQRHYFKGEHVTGAKGSETHINKRRLKPPRKLEDGE
jgi:hypothetical protein